jgi:hypothetical protein
MHTVRTGCIYAAAAGILMTAAITFTITIPIATIATIAIAITTMAARAATPEPSADMFNADTRYLHDRIACQRQQARQDKLACLRKAAAAHRVAPRDVPDHDDAVYSRDTYQRNRHLRCDPLPDGLRDDCHARMDGAGTTTGSVAEGGIYRELVTRTPAAGAAKTEPAPQPAPAEKSSDSGGEMGGAGSGAGTGLSGAQSGADKPLR